MSVQGMHILMRLSSTSILLLGQALTQELWSTTKLSGKTKITKIPEKIPECDAVFTAQEHAVQVTPIVKSHFG